MMKRGRGRRGGAPPAAARGRGRARPAPRGRGGGGGGGGNAPYHGGGAASLAEVVEAAGIAIARSDGRALASSLRFPPPPFPADELPAAEDQCGRLENPFSEVFAAYFAAVPPLLAEDYPAAYPRVAIIFKEFTKAFSGSEGNWLLPALNSLVVALRIVAKQADAVLVQKGEKAEKLEAAEREIKSCYPITYNDRAPLLQSKKWGCLCIINNLFKIYFHLNNLRLCQNLIAYVKGAGFPELTKFPIGQYVTYCYFTGRLSMFHGEYKKAREDLRIAFAKCTKTAFKNKRLILTYLIPCELLAGRLPTEELLATYELQEFGELVRSMRSGSLLAFNQALSTHQEFFIQKGVYLILEKLKYLTYRNFFKKVYLIQKNNKIKLNVFRDALRWMGVEKDNDEIECILANLIHQGYIKGYISHKLGILVVSTSNAFPPIQNVLGT